MLQIKGKGGCSISKEAKLCCSQSLWPASAVHESSIRQAACMVLAAGRVREPQGKPGQVARGRHPETLAHFT